MLPSHIRRWLDYPLLLLVLLVFSAGPAAADPEQSLRVRDDTGRVVQLPRPAERIVSLAPHVTEMLYSAGAGELIVGAVSYSDYPPAAKAIPRIGGYRQLDLEAILALQPDLIVAWQSGNGDANLDSLRRFGIPVYLTEPRQLEQIASNIERLGTLTGSAQVAHAATVDFRRRLQTLQQRYRGSRPVRVFYQVWNEPLMTINGDHLINQLIELCGGVNVFAEVPAVAPTVSLEAVLARDPEVIVASGMGEQRPEWLDQWRHWPGLTAVKRDNLVFVPPDLLQRQTVRVMQGAELLCQALRVARS